MIIVKILKKFIIVDCIISLSDWDKIEAPI